MKDFSRFEAVGDLVIKAKYGIAKSKERYFVGVLQTTVDGKQKNFGFITFGHIADRFQALEVGQKIYVIGSVESKEVQLLNNSKRYDLQIIVSDMYPIGVSNPKKIILNNQEEKPLDLLHNNMLGEC